MRKAKYVHQVQGGYDLPYTLAGPESGATGSFFGLSGVSGSGSFRIGSGVSGGLSIDGLEGSGGVAMASPMQLDAGSPAASVSGSVQLLGRLPYLITRTLLHLKQVKHERWNPRRIVG